MHRGPNPNYRRQAFDHQPGRVGYRFNPDDRGQPHAEYRDDNMGEEMWGAVAGVEPYIPPIVEDEDAIPDDFKTGPGEELIDIGGIPLKRRAVVPGLLDVEEDAHGRINFVDGAVHVGFDFPEINWDLYSLVNNVGLKHFFDATVKAPDGQQLFGSVYGPFDGFQNRMSTIEFNVNQRDYHFDAARALVPYIAYTLGCVGMWAMNHMEAVHPERKGRGLFYKAMVNMHCVFTKHYPNAPGPDTPQDEYRRFIFDKMCEADDGTYLQASTEDVLFKIIYNTFIRLCYEKLDDNVVPHVPDIDSRYEFYSIRTVSVTVFQYEPLRVGKFIKAPEELSRSKCIINPKVEDDCFRYSVLLGIFLETVPKKKWKGLSNLNQKGTLDCLFRLYGISANFDSVPSPVFIYNEKTLNNFCRDNPELFLTVWVKSDRLVDRVPVHPIYQTPNNGKEHKNIHLLLLTQSEELVNFFDYVDDLMEEQRPLVDHHFACITNIDGLFYTSSGNHRVHVCPLCNIRRRVDTKGMGFCPKHEQIKYKMAVEKRFRTPDQIKDAVTEGNEVYTSILNTFCPKCSNSFQTSGELETHLEECLVRDNNYRIVNLPKERQYLELSGRDKIKLTMLHTFMVADFESVLDPVGSYSGNQYFSSEHIPCSYSLVMESDYSNLCKFRSYIGRTAEDTIKDFCETILKWSQEVHCFYRTYIPMENLSREQVQIFIRQTHCYICGKVFTNANGSRRVRDHDHLTGKYLGAACEGCNINRRPDRMYIPLFFHNGKNYDTHLLIKEITKAKYGCQFEGIAQNSQKIMSFKIIQFKNEEQPDGSIVTNRAMCDIKVLDSILFLLSSLSKLTEIQKEKSKWNGDPRTEAEMKGYSDVFPITYKWLNRIYNQDSDTYSEKITLALRKNAYPYLWFDSFDKFVLPISHLTRLFDENKYEAFTENVTEEFMDKFEYNKKIYHQVIEAFDFGTVAQYVNLYVCMDTLQLADILQETRKVYQTVHKLDMFQFYGLPGYTWAAFQLHIENSIYKPQLFMEGEMDKVCFFARAVRGGCSDSMLRYSKVNNPHMESPGDFDPSKPQTYLLYLDANNLYGWSMSQALPYANFEWLGGMYVDYMNNLNDNYEFFMKSFLNTLGNGKGAFIMCDLEFPANVHDKMNWYPLAPESACVPEEWISNTARDMHAIAETKHDSKSKRLLQTLVKHEKYVTYYKNLIFYLKHGLVITHIHKIMTFSEFPLMKSYIDLNTQMRNKATFTAEKNQWKNANNSAYGKTFENKMGYSNIEFVSQENYNKTVRDPGFDGCVYASDNLMLAKVLYTSVDYDKPIYLGVTITELAKLRMFWFYYDVLQDHFGPSRLKLCMTDTDSLLIEVQSNDIGADISTIQVKYDCPFDTSTLPKEFIEKYGIEGQHNKEVGYFKFEAEPYAIQEFVGLRPKVYSAREMENPEAHMRCKGTPKDSMKLYVRHENYLQCLFHNYTAERMRQDVDVNKIQSKDHNIFSIKTSKVSLSCNDSKRYILRDNITTLAFGHYGIPQYEKIYEKKEKIDSKEYVSPLIKDIPELGYTGVI